MLKLGEASDEDLWKLSVSEKRILITFDLDFADVREDPHRFGPGIIIFRTRSTKSATVNARLQYIFDHYSEEELQGKTYHYYRDSYSFSQHIRIHSILPNSCIVNLFSNL